MESRIQNKQAWAGPPGLDQPMLCAFGFLPRPMPLSMVPPFGAYPNDPRLAANSGEDNSILFDQNMELLRKNMRLRAEIDYMLACNAMSGATSTSRVSRTNRRSKSRRLSFKEDGDDMSRTPSTATTMAMSCSPSEGTVYSEAETPKSRVSQSSRRSKNGKISFKADGGDMSPTPSTATTMAMSRVPSQGTIYSEAETPISRVSRTNRQSKSGRLNFKEDGDDMSRTTSAATTMAMNRVPSEGNVCSETETPRSRVSPTTRQADVANDAYGRPKDEPAAESEKASKVRFALPRDVEEHFGDGDSTDQGRRTAMMMKNIPKEYTRAMLIELLDNEGFNGFYQLVYVPVMMETEMNYCYAFVCLSTEEHAEKFRQHFTGFKNWIVSSDKVCEVRFNEQLPNIEGHIQRYKDSPMMHSSVDDRFKPALFENGKRVAFPAPSKVIRAPRNRNKKSATAGA